LALPSRTDPLARSAREVIADSFLRTLQSPFDGSALRNASSKLVVIASDCFATRRVTLWMPCYAMHKLGELNWPVAPGPWSE